MRLVSFNIHHGTVAKRGPVDPGRLGEVCASFEADVICLQEVDQATLRSKGADLAAQAAAGAGMDHAFGASQRHLGGRYGNAVLVRGEVHRATVTRLPKVPRTRFWQEQRSVLEVDATVGGAELRVACTHLAVKQWNNGPQLAFLLAHLAAAPRPLVVMGDFNRPFDAVAPHAEEVGLHAAPHDPTYPAGTPTRSIDHGLLSPELRVVRTEARSTPMSDHAALVVDVEVVSPARR